MAAKKKPGYAKEIDGFTVEFYFKRGEYDADVKDSEGKVVEELCYPKFGPHNTAILDSFAREAVGIAKHNIAKASGN